MEDLTCLVDGCANPLLVVKRRLCRTHYRRWQRHGDPSRETLVELRDKRGIPDGFRACTRCDAVKPDTEFHIKSQRPGSRMRHCKDCHYSLVDGNRRSNLDAARAYKRAWVSANIDKVRHQDIVQKHRRRLRMASAVVDPAVSIPALRDMHGDCCSYCGIEMAFERVARGGPKYAGQATIDHKLPICRGGSHTFENTVLACRRCNLEKNARTVDEWRAGMRVPKSLRLPLISHTH